MDCGPGNLTNSARVAITFLLNYLLWVFAYLGFTLILIFKSTSLVSTLIICTQHVIDSSIPVKVPLWCWVYVALSRDCSGSNWLTCCLTTSKLQWFLLRAFLAASADSWWTEIGILVVVLWQLSVAVLTRHLIADLVNELLFTYHLWGHLLLRYWLLWVAWSRSLAQDIAVDTWNRCRQLMLHYCLISSGLTLDWRHSTRAQSIWVSLFGLLRKQRHHFIHLLIVNHWLLLLICIRIRITIRASWRTVIRKLRLFRSTTSFHWFYIDPNLFTEQVSKLVTYSMFLSKLLG